jgi:hypothetical protein
MGDVLLRGGCPCDAARFEITNVFDAGYCHCNRCRKQTGAPVFAFVHVPRAAFRRLGAVFRKTIFDIYAAMPSSWNTPRMAARSAS